MAATDRMQLVLQAMASGGPEVQALQRDVEALLKSFGKIKEKTDEAAKTTGFEKFAAGVKEFIQSPLQAAGNAAEGFLKQMGPVGAGLSAGALGLGLFAKASFNAAKELGAYGDRIGDTAVRLGMTAKEVGQFTFAMRRAGGDIGSVETAVRTLSKGMSSFDDEGKEVRRTLRELGVTTREPKEALVQLAAAFGKMENTANRNTLAIRIFGRSALELLPDLLELPEGLKRAQELRLAPNEADIKRWGEYHQQVVEVEERLAKLRREAKEPIAATFLMVAKWFTGEGNEAQARAIAARSGLAQKGTRGAEEMTVFEQIFGQLRPSAPTAEWAYTWPAIDAWTVASTGRAKTRIAADETSFGRTRAGVEANLRAAETAEAARREEYFAYTGIEYGAVKARQAWLDQAEAAAKYKRELEAIEKREKDRKDLIEATQKLSAAAGKFYQGQMPTSFSLGGRQMYLPSTGTEKFRESPGYLKPFEEQMSGIGLQWSLRDLALGKASGGGERQLASFKQFEEWYAGEQDRIEKSRRAALDHQMRMVELTAGPNGELAAARQIHELRLGAAKTQEEAARATYDYEERIAQVNRERMTAWRNTVGSAFDSLISGGSGASAFLKSFGVGTTRTMVQNLASTYLKPGSLRLPGQGTEEKPTFWGNLLRGTPLGLDASTIKLDASALKLSAAGEILIRAGQSLSFGGGGGMPSRTWDLIAGTLPAGLGIGGGSATQMPSRTWDLIAGTLPYKLGGNSSKYAGLTKGLGIGSTIAAGAYGAYSGFSAGGAQGALTGAASILGSASMLLSMAKPLAFLGPLGMVGSLGLGVAAMLFGNPKQKRSEQLEAERQRRAYTEPTGSDYVTDLYGREIDYSYRGGMRVYKTVVVNAQIDTMDASSFRDFARSNDVEFGAAVASAVASGNGEALVGTLREVL